MITDFLRRRSIGKIAREDETTTTPGAACPTPHVRRLVVVTGADMSADAGLSTFHGPAGPYRNIDAAPVRVGDLADRPEAVFDFVRDLHRRAQETEPHRGHHALARCQQDLARRGGDLTLVTTNIDDLHDRAGADALYLHGRAWLERCNECDYAAAAAHTPRPCPHCGASVRPDVVQLGEPKHPDAAYRAKRAMRKAEAVYVIGSCGMASSIDRWLLAARRDYGIPTVLIATEPQAPFVELFDIVIEDRGARLGRYLPAAASASIGD